ncbi:MAG: hypothetical protein E6X43_07615 [Peptostreptococcaceae bacterium]|nr:hypothetical protein [Peptostreptococcaceae bacterium]
MATNNYTRLVDRYIKDYILAPYKVKVLKLDINELGNKETEKEINRLYDFMELIKDNIEDEYLMDLDLLFRYSIKEITERSNYYNKNNISKIKKKVRKKFQDLMVQEGLL